MEYQSALRFFVRRHRSVFSGRIGIHSTPTYDIARPYGYKILVRHTNSGISVSACE